MKLKKIFAGMAASAIAMTTFAVGGVSVNAADVVTGNAGITFQTDGNYTYRDITNTDGDHGVFPQQEVGCAGGANGFSTIAAGDTAINGDGTYTVTIPTSGTIDIEPDLAKPANKKAWYINEEKGVTRMGSKWDMRGSYEPPAGEEGAEEDPDAEIPPVEEWELQAGNTKFNMLCVSTDIPAYYNKETHQCYLDEAMTKEVKVTDVTVDVCGTSYTGATAVWKDDVDTVCIALINAYAEDAAGSTIDASAFPQDEGEISATFTISGLSGTTESGADSNASGADSSGADSTSGSSSSSASSSSKSSSNGGSKSGGTTTKTTTTTSTEVTASASDATENAESGAPAGIALALAAVAGAVVVVSKRK